MNKYISPRLEEYLKDQGFSFLIPDILSGWIYIKKVYSSISRSPLYPGLIFGKRSVIEEIVSKITVLSFPEIEEKLATSIILSPVFMDYFLSGDQYDLRDCLINIFKRGKVILVRFDSDPLIGLMFLE